MIAVACLALGLALAFWAPSARADETSPGSAMDTPTLESGGAPQLDPPSGGSGSVDPPQDGGSGGTPDPQPQDGGGGGASDPQPQDGGSGGGGGSPDPLPQDSGSGGGGGSPDPLPQDSGSGGAGSADAQHEATVEVVSTLLSPPTEAGATPILDPLNALGTPELIPTSAVMDDTFDIFDLAAGTEFGDGGASGLLMHALSCRCYTGSRGLMIGPGSSSSRLQERGEQPPDLAKASAPTGPGSGGPTGHLFGVFGGGGGAAAGFVLLSAFAVLTAALRRRELTFDLQLPTARWWPSAYVPPIESPG
jgi:hypothetical protein